MSTGGGPYRHRYQEEITFRAVHDAHMIAQLRRNSRIEEETKHKKSEERFERAKKIALHFAEKHRAEQHSQDLHEHAMKETTIGEGLGERWLVSSTNPNEKESILKEALVLSGVEVATNHFRLANAEESKRFDEPSNSIQLSEIEVLEERQLTLYNNPNEKGSLLAITEALMLACLEEAKMLEEHSKSTQFPEVEKHDSHVMEKLGVREHTKIPAQDSLNHEQKVDELEGLEYIDLTDDDDNDWSVVDDDDDEWIVVKRSL
jgi:hypothetical protein